MLQRCTVSRSRHVPKHHPKTSEVAAARLLAEMACLAGWLHSSYASQIWETNPHLTKIINILSTPSVYLTLALTKIAKDTSPVLQHFSISFPQHFNLSPEHLLLAQPLNPNGTGPTTAFHLKQVVYIENLAQISEQRPCK